MAFILIIFRGTTSATFSAYQTRQHMNRDTRIY